METEYLKKFGRRVRELRQDSVLSLEKFLNILLIMVVLSTTYSPNMV